MTNKTWLSFPLIREIVSGSSESQIVTKEAYNEAFIERFVAAGIRLAKRGAVGMGIITSCGFLALTQMRRVKELQPKDLIQLIWQVEKLVANPKAFFVIGRLAERLPIPIATSALIQIPSLRALLP